MESEHSARPLPMTDRASALEQTAIREMFDLAEQQGGDLIRLEVGEPDFEPPEHVLEAAEDAVRSGDTGYTPNAGVLDLREAISERLATDHEIEYDPQTEITATVGAMEAMYVALQTIAGPGEEVVLPTPAWANYTTQVQLAGARPVEVALPADDGFDLDPERIADAIGPKTAGVILSTPSNPTGRVYAEEDIAAVVDAAAEHDAYVIADEVYKALTFEGSTRAVASYVDHPDRVLTVGSCSKTYAMTGWRLGWLAGPAPVVGAATLLHASVTACASVISQQAAIAALAGPQEPVEEMLTAFERRRDLVVDRVAEIPTISCARPEGAFYAFLDVSELEGSATDVAKRLLREEGVVAAPGDGFGTAGQGYLRLSFAASEERLDEGFDRIEAFVRREVS